MCARKAFATTRHLIYYRHHPAKKKAKRLEKEAKLAAKAAKAAPTAPAEEKKAKEKAAREEVAPFVNTTPKGQKKGEFVCLIYVLSDMAQTILRCPGIHPTAPELTPYCARR